MFKSSLKHIFSHWLFIQSEVLTFYCLFLVFTLFLFNSHGFYVSLCILYMCTALRPTVLFLKRYTNKVGLDWTWPQKLYLICFVMLTYMHLLNYITFIAACWRSSLHPQSWKPVILSILTTTFLPSQPSITVIIRCRTDLTQMLKIGHRGIKLIYCNDSDHLKRHIKEMANYFCIFPLKRLKWHVIVQSESWQWDWLYWTTGGGFSY